MKRREIFKFLGLAPVIGIAGIAAAVTREEPESEGNNFMMTNRDAELRLSPDGSVWIKGRREGWKRLAR